MGPFTWYGSLYQLDPIQKSGSQKSSQLGSKVRVRVTATASGHNSSAGKVHTSALATTYASPPPPLSLSWTDVMDSVRFCRWAE